MNVNWPMLGVILLGCLIWYGILCWSAWKTILVLVVCSAVCGIIMRLKENRY